MRKILRAAAAIVIGFFLFFPIQDIERLVGFTLVSWIILDTRLIFLVWPFLAWLAYWLLGKPRLAVSLVLGWYLMWAMWMLLVLVNFPYSTNRGLGLMWPLLSWFVYWGLGRIFIFPESRNIESNSTE
jgi:hypothetical protein